MTQDFLTLIAEAIEKDEASLNMADAFRTYEEWDSLAFLSIIASLDEHYGLVIDTTVFNGLETLEDLYSYCQTHKV